MRRLPFLPLLLASLAACTLSLPVGPDKTGPDEAGLNRAVPAAITPGAVTVTSLDSPAPAQAAASQAKAEPAAPAAPKVSAQPEASADAAQPQASAPPATAEQTACEAKGGIWSATGASGLRSCLQPTRDAGKSCRREGDCDGLCLARSRTCAPVKPLFGCNDILQSDGSPATLCLD